MKIEYKIKGVTLDVHDLVEISNYLAAACTAELLLDDHGDQVTTEEQALTLGYEVRRQMDKYGYCEEEAIDLVLDSLILEEYA